MRSGSVNTILDIDPGPDFCPPSWLRNGHLQTIYAAYLFQGLKPESSIEHQIALDDGDTLMIHDDCPTSWKPGDRVVLLVHGLSGCAASSHVARVSHKFNDLGFRTIRMDQRGSGAGAFIAKRHTYAGASHDLAEVVNFMVKLIVGSPISIIGCSMGGNILMKYLCEDPDLVPRQVDSAIAVSPPIDLARCAWNLRRGFNRVYDYRFLRRVYRSWRERRQNVPDLVDFPTNPRPFRLLHFDDMYVAPAAGYRSAREYYSKSSSAPMLHQCRVPTLLLTAKDDPLIPFDMYLDYPLSDAIRFLVTDCGGHLGYINSQSEDPDRRWLDWRMCDWISQLPNTNCNFIENVQSPNGSAKAKATNLPTQLDNENFGPDQNVDDRKLSE